MKLKNSRITILFDREGLNIDIIDNDASITFVKIHLTPEQTVMALSRLSYTPCSIEIQGIKYVGKKMEWKTLEFEIPDDYMKYKENALKVVEDKCPKGWTSDNYFNRQDSFFKKDGKQCARVTIRRWI